MPYPGTASQYFSFIMLFPVLLTYKSRCVVTHFSLRARARGTFILGDSLALSLGGSSGILDLFLGIARRYFPDALHLQADWPVASQARTATNLGLNCLPRIEGDSWLLPLFFAVACGAWERKWPEKFLASGSIRICRGLRCVSIGRAIYKLRAARSLGKVCLLPKSNVTILARRNVNLTNCVPLPFNLDSCLDIWRSCQQ